MANAAGKLGMKVLTIAVGIPVARVTKNAVERAWAAARPDNPPREASDRNARWGDAIGYAVLTAAGGVIAKLATRKGAEQTWRAITGLEPPPPAPTKEEKKALKKAERAAKKAGAAR